MKMKKILALLLALLLTVCLIGCSEADMAAFAEVAEVLSEAAADDTVTYTTSTDGEIEEDGWYYSAEDVTEYIVTYGELPDNFITKNEARDLGWEGGSVEDYAPGYAIGGDRFGNYEGLLPDDVYYECDIDTDGTDSRGAKRIVFSDDQIYYTEDHYETFVLLYTE